MEFDEGKNEIKVNGGGKDFKPDEPNTFQGETGDTLCNTNKI